MWKPPKSPHGLIQEDLWPDEWKILVSCLMLNQTTRKQVDSVVDSFFSLWPTPEKFIEADLSKVSQILRPLGFHNRRPKTIHRFTREYLVGGWKQPIELYGIGKYANDAWHIFCKGDWQSVDPNDHALNKYHGWMKAGNEKVY
jgi:methyl-CpG-binding domain protein 4